MARTPLARPGEANWPGRTGREQAHAFRVMRWRAAGGSVGRAVVCFGGDDRLVSEYMESEFLTRTPAPVYGSSLRSACPR
ncbi:MAG: hypothetical protein ACRDNW_18755 [Trebonia sp.]